jgi:hypothetical protein
LAAEPKRWISVTAPVLAAVRFSPACLSDCCRAAQRECSTAACSIFVRPLSAVLTFRFGST